MRVLSLGAGVQSTALAMMSEAGEMPPLDLAIFADTGWESQFIYDHLQWVTEQVSFPVKLVGSKKLREDLMAGRNNGGQEFFSVPVFVKAPSGKWSISRRQCTREYKIEPIIQEIRSELGLQKRQHAPKGTRVEQWLGISTDEIFRAKTHIPQNPPWIETIYPLIDANLSRLDCLQWFESRYPGRELRKSSCIGCPYRSPREWRDMYRDRPEEYADAVLVENTMRDSKAADRFDNNVSLFKGQQLADVNWDEMPEQSDMFDECEGFCHV